MNTNGKEIVALSEGTQCHNHDKVKDLSHAANPKREKSERKWRSNTFSDHHAPDAKKK